MYIINFSKRNKFMNVLMLSSSKYAEYEYLAYASQWIDEHLHAVDEIVFIPYAGVTIAWDAYTQKVQDALPNYKVLGIHQSDDAKATLQSAKAILVGGGNTFNLLNELYKQDIVSLIQSRVEQDVPYVGWSAGSNICGMSIRTTNDMPIIEPPSFDALRFVSAQLNPHYSDYVAPGFHGETRDQRLAEFCTLHPSTPVLAIREGSALLLRNNKLRLLGDLSGFVFESENKLSIDNTTDLSEYL
jgi:dipeptidase E